MTKIDVKGKCIILLNQTTIEQMKLLLADEGVQRLQGTMP